MLERVALGQTRFATPGLAVDARGVALGRFGALLFGSLDGVVGWLRLYSDEAGLEDVLAELKILRVRSPAGARAFVILVPAPTSYALDRAARCARLWSGVCFTGTARHFVRYRDEKSPYGYDVVDAAAVRGEGELVLHAEDGSAAYAEDGELDVRQLVFRLSPVRVPGGERLDAEGRASLWLTVPAGLAEGVTRYLWKNRVATEVAPIALAAEARREFAAAGSPDGHLLCHVSELPERLLESFRGIPGLAVYRPIGERVGVEVGYRHPIELSSCTALFDPAKLYLFDGAHDACWVVAGPVELSDVRHLVKIDLALDRPRERAASARPAESVGQPLRLAPSLVAPRRVVGTLIGWSEAPRLKQLVYALPPVMLRGHRVATAEQGLLLVADGNVDVIPLGTLLGELAPGLYLPLGMDLVPRVAPEVVAEALGHVAGRLTVFPHDGAPFHVPESDLRPLERRTLAALDVPRSPARDLSLVPPAEAPRVVNDAVGAFALWGFPAPKKNDEA
jgi:hypothetical protein